MRVALGIFVGGAGVTLSGAFRGGFGLGFAGAAVRLRRVRARSLRISARSGRRILAAVASNCSGSRESFTASYRSRSMSRTGAAGAGALPLPRN